VQSHFGLVQKPADRGAGAVAEDPERLLLRGDQAQLDLRAVVRGAVGCGHQRQVVQRQRPARPSRPDERQLVDPALAQLVEQQPVAGPIATAVIGEHTLGLPLALGVGAEREHQLVIGKLVTISGDHTAPIALHTVERSTAPACTELGRSVLQPEATRALDLERLIDGHRAIDELQLGGEERDVDAISGQRPQRQQRLKPRHPRAGNQHAAHWRPSRSGGSYTEARRARVRAASMSPKSRRATS
jgi:hypothetical protein